MQPSEKASLTLLQLAGLATETGLSDGVLNVVTGLGSMCGAALAEHGMFRNAGQVCIAGTRLPFGLAAGVWTSNLSTAHRIRGFSFDASGQEQWSHLRHRRGQLTRDHGGEIVGSIHAQMRAIERQLALAHRQILNFR